MRCHDFTNAIVRTPAQSVVDGLRSHDGPGPGHAEVLAEHRAYVAALEAAGVAVGTLPPLEEYPDSVFVEDPALVFGEGAILLRPGAATRIGETREMLPVLERNFADVQILEAGFADGGDIMVTPDALVIGLSARTDETGARSLAGALERLGRRSRIVTPPEGALHLKTIASMIDEETILTTRAGAASGIFAGFRLVLVDSPEEPAANALRVNGTLLLSAGHPRIAEKLDSLGYSPTLIDTDHIARIDAGLSCMSLRWTSARP